MHLDASRRLVLELLLEDRAQLVVVDAHTRGDHALHDAVVIDLAADVVAVGLEGEPLRLDALLELLEGEAVLVGDAEHGLVHLGVGGAEAVA